MKEFMLLFRNAAPVEAYSSSPEEMQKTIPVWQEWMRKLAEEGRFVSTAPLEKDGYLIKKEGVTDGPYAEVKEVVQGYLIFKAKDFEEAIEIGKGCPNLIEGEGSVEVRPVAQFEI